MKKQLRETAHDIATTLHKVGALDSITMREIDKLCVMPIKELKPREIRSIRLHEKVSQAVFAVCLNTTRSTVNQWEMGKKHPRGTSLKLLTLVAKKGLMAIIT